MPDLAEICERLQTARGRNFEVAVSDAFGFLNLDSETIEATDAESDVIVEAKTAENPYYAVVECSAVESTNQVPYDKLGQIRGNFTKYMDDRRQRLFKTGYKLIVGRPEFSRNTKTSAQPDVGLMKGNVLIELVQRHLSCHFSQDELEKVLGIVGTIESKDVHEILFRPYQRKLDMYSLVYVSLLENPFKSKRGLRKPSTRVDQIFGEVIAYANMLRIIPPTIDEVSSAIRDLSNPFLKSLETKGDYVRLSSLPIDIMKMTGGKLGNELMTTFKGYLDRLKRMVGNP